MTTCDYESGLDGIPAAQSRISYVDGQTGELEYRGISIAELAEKSSFLETAFLLIWGYLPNPEDLAAFEYEVIHHRRIKYRLVDMMKCFPESGHPLDALQAAVAALGLYHSRRALNDPAYIRRAVVRLLAKIPTAVAAFEHIRKGNDPVRPRDDLNYAANFLYMLKEQEPEPLQARIFDLCLILHAEHTMNASTFSARVTASTLNDPYAVVASATGTLGGRLHGGANEEVVHMLTEIGSVENVQPYLDLQLAEGNRIMGFGHRIYKVKDPRAKILQGLAEQLSEKYGCDRYYGIALALEQAVEDRLGDRQIHANVEFYSGLIFRQLGFPADLFSSIFAIARVAGWLAHWKEQLEANRIYRPSQIYTGDHDQAYIPIAER
ncbi:MAG: citrate synthase [Acaryochloris sp. RU_4_1]|nr:citrate synthase [Acaryochloris sp. SU_5_25]NJM66542.1 citrate synthase [Acaryochloris sp. RU_4_1]NJN39452.1 citrate synthase [Acaryochloridaceae cyanobacterium CSU_3_4]NJR55262.1 citrate synthase [Acaryochloris sp. CRU_2_0]